MAASVWIAVLAHAHREALEDLLESVRCFVPEAEMVVFNGGTDSGLTAGLDVATCPYSRPLRLGNLVPFHVGVMRWLEEAGHDYDFLVTVDWDVLFVRSGLAPHLEQTMASSAFMGAGYLVVPPIYPEWDCARWINYGWQRWWRPLFGTELPSWAFNPGLVFRREYAQKALRFEGLPRILERAARSRIYGIEEWVYASLAVTLGCEPIRNPGSAALQNRPLTVPEIEAGLADPNVFVMHKIGPAGAPDREALRRCRAGQGYAPDRLASAGPAPGMSSPTGSWRDRARERLKDAYFHLLP